MLIVMLMILSNYLGWESRDMTLGFLRNMSRACWLNISLHVDLSWVSMLVKAVALVVSTGSWLLPPKFSDKRVVDFFSLNLFVFVDFYSKAILYMEVGDATDKALQLSGREVRGLNIVVTRVRPPLKPGSFGTSSVGCNPPRVGCSNPCKTLRKTLVLWLLIFGNKVKL